MGLFGGFIGTRCVLPHETEATASPCKAPNLSPLSHLLLSPQLAALVQLADAAHAAEMGDDPKKSSPFFFQKPASAIVDTTKTSALKYPRDTTNYHYEAELVLGIGKDSAGVVPLSEARSYITSVGVGCDLTRRDLQNEAKEKRRPWDDSKGVEDSGPIGGLIEVGEGDDWWYSGKIAFWVRGSKASTDGRKHSFNSLSLLHNSPIPFRGFVADIDRGRS